MQKGADIEARSDVSCIIQTPSPILEHSILTPSRQVKFTFTYTLHQSKRTAVLQAAMVNNLEVVKVLIQHKADVNAKDIVRLLMCHLYTSLNIIFFFIDWANCSSSY